MRSAGGLSPAQADHKGSALPFSKGFSYNSFTTHEETRKSAVPVDSLHGIEVRPIRRGERIRQYHYLGLHSLIGESIRYLAI
ncbi:MAG: putative transposase [Candidatus Brocadia fulgida]|uniref:Transposase n=1 Tax=Candidatus Brocadia fulgida TaxID=380242 RepID=A0A0M2UX22_9BACT|nr:MAG: putative transposase [Candidatus Brocadia fulgida]